MANKDKKKSKAYLIRRFFSIVFLMVFSFLVLAGIGTTGYLHFTKDRDIVEDDNTDEDKKGVLDFFKKNPKKIRTNVAIFGVDEDQTRTDVMMVATFNSETKKIDLISIPRDTRVFLTEATLADMRSRNSRVPDTVKINEVHAYAGKERASEYSVKEIERLLGIKIDYYIKMNLEGFRKIVDKMDGVDINLPRDFYYVDRSGGLYINLKAGPQTLYGKEAEQLVRWRKNNDGSGYGDLGRIETQQLFLKAFAKKALSPRNIPNIPSIVTTLFKYIDTDVNLDDALKYVKYLSDIDLENINMVTIPGEARMIGSKSYFIHDEIETKELVDKIFYTDEKKEEPPTTEDSKDAHIEVLNGGSVGGLAQKTSDELKIAGYNVVKIGNYKGTKEQKTRIFVKKEGWGEDLKEYFENSTVIINDSTLDANVDIQIVLGLDEK
ncbi:MAG: LCP family protein [Epulopiscium sp.]|nr:LCP family protein [Candidatus Epulonipiscium sp.]